MVSLRLADHMAIKDHRLAFELESCSPNTMHTPSMLINTWISSMCACVAAGQPYCEMQSDHRIRRLDDIHNIRLLEYKGQSANPSNF